MILPSHKGWMLVSAGYQFNWDTILTEPGLWQIKTTDSFTFLRYFLMQLTETQLPKSITTPTKDFWIWIIPFNLNHLPLRTGTLRLFLFPEFLNGLLDTIILRRGRLLARALSVTVGFWGVFCKVSHTIFCAFKGIRVTSSAFVISCALIGIQSNWKRLAIN